MMESERSGAKSDRGAAGSVRGRALQLPELRRGRHASAAFIAATRAGGAAGSPSGWTSQSGVGKGAGAGLS